MPLGIVGRPPELKGRRCDALICQGFVDEGVAVATAGVVHIRCDGIWHRLTIDCGVLIWRRSAEFSASWEVPEEGWEYPLTDVGAMIGVIGRYFGGYEVSFTPAGL
jgi:hypothetical protein